MKLAEPLPGYLFGAPAGYLLDVNVWLAAVANGHPHHHAALDFVVQAQRRGDALWFCRATMLGLVRLLAQPAVMGASVNTLVQAWSTYRTLLGAPGIRLLIEPPEVDDSLDQLIISRQNRGSRHLTDFYLLALAQVGRLTLVTFDRALAEEAPAHSKLLLAEPRGN